MLKLNSTSTKLIMQNIAARAPRHAVRRETNKYNA
jgi:hypothetical protein